ncbi:MAG: hypothetical protein OEZ36_08585 [Spirochaetota bacterium]|nr:hypothetical protein [Spirochaetota bacterium]
MIALYAALITLAVVVLIVLLAFVFTSRAKSSEPDQNVIAGLYKIRTVYFVVLLGIIFVLLFITLSSQKLPYHETQTKKAEFKVAVIAEMWQWTMTDPSGNKNNNIVVPSNKEVEFVVTSKDVNHGIGIYNAGGQLLAQTQVMPGYTNRLRYSFKKGGEYHVLCMEFCGTAHHGMFSKFTVK